MPSITVLEINGRAAAHFAVASLPLAAAGQAASRAVMTNELTAAIRAFTKRLPVAWLVEQNLGCDDSDWVRASTMPDAKDTFSVY
jgi:hypothetical protein